MGDVGFEVLHTPGHTPEHVSLLIHDRSVGEEPAALLSGGALLVGDVARPDLLGGAAPTREGAAAMCETLRTKILTLPDHVEVFPTHVAGSLCGGHIGERLSTTIGYERRTNPLLARITSEDVFVRECLDLANLPAVPPYWPRMRGQNLAGPASVGTVAEPPALTVEAFEKLRDGGAVVLDGREPEAFAGGHDPGSAERDGRRLVPDVGGDRAARRRRRAARPRPFGRPDGHHLGPPADRVPAAGRLARRRDVRRGGPRAASTDRLDQLSVTRAAPAAGRGRRGPRGRPAAGGVGRRPRRGRELRHRADSSRRASTRCPTGTGARSR